MVEKSKTTDAPTSDGLTNGYTYAGKIDGGVFIAAGFRDIFGSAWYFAGNPNVPHAIGISQDVAAIVAQCAEANPSGWSMWLTELESPLALKLELGSSITELPVDTIAQRQVNDLAEHVRILEELLALEKLANQNNG